MAEVVSAPDEVLQLSPLPETVQDAFPTFQYTDAVEPLGTSRGTTWRWPVRLPEELNSGGATRQVDEPGEQNCGDMQVAVVAVEQEVLVYWISLPEQE